MSESQSLVSRLNDAIYGKLPNLAAATALLSEAHAELLKCGARIASLIASLDDAHREVSRLTGEKHARDTVIHEAIGVLERLHRQGEQP